MAPNISSGVEGQTTTRRKSPAPEVKPITQEKPSTPPDQKKEKTLGSYKDATVSMVVLVVGYVVGLMATKDLEPDARTENWFLMQSSLIPLLSSVFYILISAVWGPRYMANKEAYCLKKYILAYNVFQVAFSAWMFYEVAISGWLFNYNYTCQACDRSTSPNAIRMATACWFFFASKILDFADTFFFVARKKFNQISQLHLVHHSSMVVNMWFGVKYLPGGHCTFMGFLNTAVHTIMYFYYLLACLGPALRPYLWWKKYLTTIQLVQFVLVFFHSLQVLLRPSCTDVPKGFVLWTIMNAVVFFGLFINFYVNAYKKKPSRPTTNESQKFIPNSEYTKSTTDKIEAGFDKLMSGHMTHRNGRSIVASSFNAS